MSAARVARALRGGRHLCWLDGGPAHPVEGRWSFVGVEPVEVRCARWGEGGSPLRMFEALGSDERGQEARDAWGAAAYAAPRWMGFVAYDAAEPGRRGRRLPREDGAPVAWLARYDAVFAWDEGRREALIVGDDEAACARLATRIDDGRHEGRHEGGREGGDAAPPAARVGAPMVADGAQHLGAVVRALEHIAAGDIYQVNLARRWCASFEGSPLALFEAMREASPVPLGAFVDAGEHVVLARTMERFLSWEGPGGELSTRPIKGTIAREGDDNREAATLRADQKEQAEHSMIVDLMRNDLGRVARVGTVTVEAPLVVEPYAGLSHLVSTVRCQTREGVGLGAILEATFPPGSVTGTPKLRAMEIIEDLEEQAREVYTGCVGMIDRRGGARLAVAIRTAQVRRGEVVYHAGGGLVAASDPAREVAETELKARVFLDAVAALSGPR